MKLLQSRYNSQCKLSQQDLRDISEEIIETYAPHDNHQSELVLMPVDPVNLYAYWNLPENKTGNEINTEANPIDKQFALRIYTIPEHSESASNIKLSFDVKVDGLNNQQKSELGRFNVTHIISDIGKFKTPTLRNISLTAPYMHDGSLQTLEQVVEYYDKGNKQNRFVDAAIFPLHFSKQEKADLVEFMKALNSQP